MVVHATDTDDRWHVTMTPDGITTSKGTGPADVALTGSAADLYLTVWNRGDDSDIDVTGDRDLLETWHTHHRVRWS
jgi:predicted lipid carrier protein YhbT